MKHLLARLLLLVALAAPAAVHAQREKLSMADLEIVEKKWPGARRTSTGLRYVILTPGTGTQAKRGDDVSVIYTGRLMDGTVFDENQNREKPFTFRVGRGQVIEGWDEALQLMKVGEKRILIIPHELAYGTRGRSPTIPRQAALVFEVELLSVKTPEFPPVAPSSPAPAPTPAS